MGSQIVQIAFIILLSVFSIHICHGFSASHQHQVTYSESDDETHYGYRSSPLSVSYDDDDSYGAEESSSGPRVITGSGRMTILDKRSSQETSTKNQPEIVSRSKSTNNDQQQQQQQQSNGQNDQSMGPAITNYHVEWTESIDHGPSKSSSKSSLTPGQPQPQLFQSQMQPQFPVNNGYSAYPGHSSSSVSDNYKEYVDTQPIGYNYKGQQFSEPSVGYSESRIDSEWQFPDFMKELKRTEKDEKKDKDKVKKEDKKAEYEEDHWYQEPAKEKEEVKKEEKEEKKDDKFEFDWSDPWSEKPKEEKKRPKKNVDKEEKQKKEKYGDKLKKEDGEEGKVVKHEHHTHHHHDHWDDSWNSEPKKEKEKEKKKVEEYKETYDNGKKNDESYSGVKNPTVQDGDSWYDAPKKEEKYQEPSKKEEEAKGEYYSENDYQKNQDDKYYENKQHDKNQYNKDQYDNSQQNNDQNDNHQYDNNQYDDGQYGNNQYDDNQHSDNAKHEDKQYDDKYYEDKPAEGGLESPEQIGRRPGDSKDKGGKGGLLESYFWKALPGGDKKDSTYNYVIHVSKIDLDKAYEKKDVKDEKMKDDY